MDPAAQRHLADRLERARQLRDGLRGPRVHEVRPSILASFGGALEALRAMGALSEDELQDWSNRMLEALGTDVPDLLPPAGPGGEAKIPIFVGDPDAPPPPPPPRPAGSLARTVVAPAVSWEYAGGRFQILSIEVYEYRVSVTWREHPLADPELARSDDFRAAERDVVGLPEHERRQRIERVRHRLSSMPLPVDSVDDDVGTEYEMMSGGSGGGLDDRRGHQDFAPAPPPEATVLYVNWHGHRIEVPLPPTDDDQR